MGCRENFHWIRGEEEKVHTVLKQALRTCYRVAGSKTWQLVAWPHGPSTRPTAIILFKNQEDCKFAAVVQPGSWYHTAHPRFMKVRADERHSLTHAEPLEILLLLWQRPARCRKPWYLARVSRDVSQAMMKDKPYHIPRKGNRAQLVPVQFLMS